MVIATVHGARGYLGRELVRLLSGHPRVSKVVPVSGTQAGSPYRDAVPAYRGPPLSFRDAQSGEAMDADVVLLATPDEPATHLARAHGEQGARLVIDLSRAHRLQGIAGNGWHYGAADVHPAPPGTKRIANPGCYPTAALLALAPALRAGLAGAGPIIVDGKSGLSGAGIQARPHLHFPEANESVTAYKVAAHDHTEEIRHAARDLDGTTDRPVRFTPHLVPQTRGLQVTTYLPSQATGEEVTAAYERAYEETPFVHFVKEANTLHVRGTNHADVAVTVDDEAGLVVARAAIDNLLKGGAGTAIQNLNDAMGWGSAVGLGGTA